MRRPPVAVLLAERDSAREVADRAIKHVAEVLQTTRGHVAAVQQMRAERDIAVEEAAINSDAVGTARRAVELANRLDRELDEARVRIARLEIEAERLRLKFSAAHRSLRVTRETLDHVCGLVEEHVDVATQTLVRDALARWLETPREANSRSPGEISREAQADLAALLGPTGGDA